MPNAVEFFVVQGEAGCRLAEIVALAETRVADLRLARGGETDFEVSSPEALQRTDLRGARTESELLQEARGAGGERDHREGASVRAQFLRVGNGGFTGLFGRDVEFQRAEPDAPEIEPQPSPVSSLRCIGRGV